MAAGYRHFHCRKDPTLSTDTLWQLHLSPRSPLPTALGDRGWGRLHPNLLVQGNYIGLDPTGTSAEPNLYGVFVNDAMNNMIGGTAPGAGNVIAGNLLVNQDGSTGIFFYQGAAGNLVQGNRIGTNASGNPGKNLGLGDYGILLYNAPRNTYPTAGKGANTIRGSGIAATREFSSSAPLATTSGATSQGRAKPVPSGPRALVRRPRSRK